MNTSIQRQRIPRTKPQAVQQQYNELLKVLESRLTIVEKELLDAAFELAFRAHEGTFRKSKEPYIIHPLNVAQIVAKDLNLDSISVISALLHDVVEDTDVTLGEIEAQFGKQIAGIVNGLTKISTDFSWYESRQAQNFQKLLCHFTKDKRIILIKLADRLDNMRSAHFLPRTKQWRIASETKAFYAPIAHRLGLSKLKIELEDLYLKTVDQDSYYSIVAKIQKTVKERQEEISEFTEPIIKAMQEQNIPFRIKTRAKSIYSIYKKLYDRKISFYEIYDLIAVRIILSSSHEKISCWQTYGIVTSLYTPNNKRKRDWISIPKSNGYESLHITVLSSKEEWVEVQIRTERMNDIATRGIAAHWKYKEKNMETTLMNKFDEWFEEMSNAVTKESNSLRAMDRASLGLYIDEVHVFSKTGQSTTFPKGATILDFAFDAFGEKGLYYSCGTVNEQVVPMGYVLANEDQVAIDLGDKIMMTKEALNFVITQKASRILQTFFKRHREKDIENGKKKLKKKMATHNISFTLKNIELFREFLEEEITNEMYIKLSKKGLINLDVALQKFVKNFSDGKITPPKHPEQMHAYKKKMLFIGAHNENQYELANCCNPIPGDELFGIIMANQMVKIHSAQCQERNKILSRYAPRVIEAKWYNPIPVEVILYIRMIDSKELTSKVLNTVKLFDVKSFFLDKSQDNELRGNIHVMIKHKGEINKLVEQLQMIKGVQEVLKN